MTITKWIAKSITNKWFYRAIAAFILNATIAGFTMPAAAAANDDRDVCYTAHGITQSDDKIAACTRVIASGALQGGDLALIYLNRGQSYLDIFEMGRALADFDQAIVLNPALAAAYDGRGLVYRFHPDRAIVDFDEAIRLDPNDAKAYVDRGAAYRAKRDTERAVADFDRAIRLAPDDADAYRNRAMAYRAKGDLDRAIADFSAAIERNPKDQFAYLDRGLAYQAKGDLDHAIADYDTTIQRVPFSHAYEVRGTAYRQKGEFDRAIADYDQAIKNDPRDAAAYHGRGLARQAKGDMEGGAADLANAHALSTIFGLSIPAFTKLHIAVSLLALLSGAVVVLGMLLPWRLPVWTALFFVSTAVTSVSGFLFPLATLSSSFRFGVTTLAVLAVALVARWLGRLKGYWRWIYVVAVLTALYLNVYVGIMRAIFGSSFLQLLLPRQMEPPFAPVTLAVLAIFIALGIAALRQFSPPVRAAA